ncbi:MAG: NADH-quinone oxidoreductase subunit N [Thermoplasmata archaeon]
MNLASFALPWLPELILLAAALLVFLLEVVGVRRLEVLGGVAVVGTLAALLLVVADLRFSPLSGMATIPASQIDPLHPSLTALFTFSSLGLIFQGIFLVSALLVALASLSRPSRDPGAATFFGLLLIATLGMLLVAVAADLIFLLIAIEITGISTYLMVGYLRKDPRGMEAAMKFYIIGALSTVLSFYGASLIFGAYGTTNLFAIRAEGGSVGLPNLVLVGYGFLIAGLAFKVTAVPFHAWAVDVYDGAPNDVSAFLAGGTKKIGLFAFFLVFLGPVLFVSSATSPIGNGSTPTDLGPILQITLGAMAVLTMTVGNVLALMQRSMKRMLAYSSISQAGYMLIGITIGTAPAITGATLQIFAHVFMKAGAFLVVAAAASLGVGPLIEDWKGFGVRRPLLGTSFALMLLSLAGVPLTIGFVSKFILFSSAIQAQGFFVYLAIAGLLNSALSVFYYARVLKVMYMDQPDRAIAGSPHTAGIQGASGADPLPLGGIGYGRAMAIGLATFAIVALGIYPQPVLAAISSAAQHFVAVGA